MKNKSFVLCILAEIPLREYLYAFYVNGREIKTDGTWGKWLPVLTVDIFDLDAQIDQRKVLPQCTTPSYLRFNFPSKGDHLRLS